MILRKTRCMNITIKLVIIGIVIVVISGCLDIKNETSGTTAPVNTITTSVPTMNRPAPTVIVTPSITVTTEAKDQSSVTPSLYDLLIEKSWNARSRNLPGAGVNGEGSLDITFMRNGEFTGTLAEGYETPAQKIDGKWRVLESELFLEYESTTLSTMGTNTWEYRLPTRNQIIFTDVYETKLLGVDTSGWAWELKLIK